MLLITTVGLGVLLNPLNTTLIAIALARVQAEFQLSFADASWMISAYYLVSAIGQPLIGKLSDMFGQKKVFISGLLLVTLSAILAPFSPNYSWLIVLRMLQAFGSSALYPAGMGMIRSQISSNQARALGIIAIFSSGTSAFGPSLGGFLLQYGDWPVIFLCNLPFVLASFLLAINVFPADQKIEQVGKHLKEMDFLGIVLFSTALLMWLLCLLSIATSFSITKLIGALILTAALYYYEICHPRPFIDVAFLKRNMVVTFIYVQFILTNIVFYSIMFGIPNYLQEIKGLDAQTTGAIMLAIAGTSVLFMPLISQLIERYSTKPVLVIGKVLITLGSLCMLFITELLSIPILLVILCVLGIANACNNLGMQVSLYNNVNKEETGLAAGLFMTSRFIGTILSTTILTALFGEQITTSSFHGMALVCAGFGLLMLVLTIKMPAEKS